MDINKRWDIFETAKDLYEETMQKGETFSYDMRKEIEKELTKMLKQKEEYDKRKQEEQFSNKTDGKGD